MKRLLNVSVIQVHFKRNETWYVQKDGLAMRACVECECCLAWYHVKCGDISDDEYRNISETVWYCRKCIAIREKNKSVQQTKLILPYVDDIVRTEKGDPEKVLWAANLLHSNLQFTIKTPNTNGIFASLMAFLDLQISIDKSRKINCG